MPGPTRREHNLVKLLQILNAELVITNYCHTCSELLEQVAQIVCE